MKKKSKKEIHEDIADDMKSSNNQCLLISPEALEHLSKSRYNPPKGIMWFKCEDGEYINISRFHTISFDYYEFCWENSPFARIGIEIKANSPDCEKTIGYTKTVMDAHTYIDEAFFNEGGEETAMLRSCLKQYSSVTLLSAESLIKEYLRTIDEYNGTTSEEFDLLDHKIRSDRILSEYLVKRKEKK